MSITSALAQAGTGLAAASRALQVASGNIANAQTPGYSVRRIDLAALSLGQAGAGVRVAGIARQTDPILQGLIRDAGAARAQADAAPRFWAAVEASLGAPDQGASLPGALAALSGALVGAADRPDLDSRLAAVVTAAQGLTARLGAVQTAVQDQRQRADAAIAQDVGALQSGLDRLHALNRDIVSARATGRPELELEDARDALLADLSQIVPLRGHVRAEGRMLVYTAQGQVLLDLEPARLGFQPAGAVDAGMTLAGGQLSGLTVNGRAVPTGATGPLAGGRLGAAFAIRDDTGPGVQAALDALAADLIARFQTPATDPSAAPGAPALFTDAGAAMGPSPAPGLAGRLALNPLVDPSVGGALWRVRDGLGAGSPGPVGDPAQIARWTGALDRLVAPGPGAPARSLAASLDDTLSALGQAGQAAQDRATYTQGVADGLAQQALAQGVDLDAETQRLLALETAYAANARVIQVADEMLRRLMEI